MKEHYISARINPVYKWKDRGTENISEVLKLCKDILHKFPRDAWKFSEGISIIAVAQKRRQMQAVNTFYLILEIPYFVAFFVGTGSS